MSYGISYVITSEGHVNEDQFFTFDGTSMSLNVLEWSL